MPRSNASFSVRRAFSAEGSIVTEQSSEGEFEVRNFKTTPAEISLARGSTINTGNFSSVRVDVSIKLPCYMEELDDALVFAKRWVGERLEEEKSTMTKREDEFDPDKLPF